MNLNYTGLFYELELISYTVFLLNENLLGDRNCTENKILRKNWLLLRTSNKIKWSWLNLMRIDYSLDIINPILKVYFCRKIIQKIE